MIERSSVNPVVVHVVRPYSSEQEYLEAEAWSIDARSMLLIGAESLPADTALLFDVALAGGQKPIRAEGRVVGIVAAAGDRPAGLKVRFKRFGAATKAFIERAVQQKTRGGELASGPVAAERPSQVQPEPDSAVQLRPPEDAPSAPEQAQPALAQNPSGNEGRAKRVTAPPHRDELLARLRERRRAG